MFDSLGKETGKIVTGTEKCLKKMKTTHVNLTKACRPTFLQTHGYPYIFTLSNGSGKPIKNVIWFYQLG